MTEQDSTIPSIDSTPEVVTIDDIQDINLLAVSFDAPKRRARAYNADQVDETLRKAQMHLDTQYKFIHANLDGTPVAPSSPNEFPAHATHSPEVFDDTHRSERPNTEFSEDSGLEEKLAFKQVEIDRINAALSEYEGAYKELEKTLANAEVRVGQLTAANVDLRHELRSALAGIAPASHETESEESTTEEDSNTHAQTVNDVSASAADILVHAERVAEEYLADAKKRADAILEEAYAQAGNVEPVTPVSLSPQEALLHISELAQRVANEYGVEAPVVDEPEGDFAVLAIQEEQSN